MIMIIFLVTLPLGNWVGKNKLKRRIFIALLFFL